MKMKMKFGCLLFATVSTVISCKKFLDIDQPRTAITSEAIFTSDGAATSAMAGVYSSMIASQLTMTDGGTTVFGGLSADELLNTAANTDYDPFKTNNLLPTNINIQSRFWSAAYQRIYALNRIVEGLEGPSSLTPALKNSLRGEAQFLRAFYYFYLTSFFGDVPLVVRSGYNENAKMARTSSVSVWAQIEQDLLDAQKLLPGSYPSVNRARPNKWAAKSLLARVYLYLKQWSKAETEADSVIASGSYALVPTAGISSTFGLSSTETIWQLAKETGNTSEGANFIPAAPSLIPTFTVTATVLNSFESGDARKTAWLGKNTVGGVEYYYPNKYKVRSSATVSEYYVVLRLAELYLIRAEASAQLGKLSEGSNDLNTIRTRAGLSPMYPATVAELLAAIEKEALCEFFAEWGHRWLDLKRRGRVDAVLGVNKGSNWQATDALYPIPQTEIDRNPLLAQNPGY